MTYSGKELSALVKLGIAMAQADGHVDEVEQLAIASELKEFGVVGEKSSIIIAGAAVMNNAEALATIAAMNDEQKKYATGYLAAVMAADGVLDDAEIKLWQLICTLGGCPTMNVNEALSFWTSH